MNNISCNEYIKENVTKDWLLKNNFRKSRMFNEEYSDMYINRFPIYRYGDAYTLECEISIFVPNGLTIINVYDYNTRYKYAPFYHENCGKSMVLNIINEKIEKELKRLGIRKKEKRGINNEGKDKKIKG